MVDELESPERRQRRLRPVGGNMGYGGLNDSTTAEGDTGLRDYIDDPAVGILPESPLGAAQEPEFTPRQRLQEVGARGTSVEREYRLRLIHRSLLRRIPIDQIALKFGVSSSQIYRDIAELKKHLRKGAQSLDSDELIGDTIGYYNEIAAMSLRMASDSKRTDSARLTALRTALASRNDMNRFLQATGVFDVLRYKPPVDQDGTSDMERMVQMTEAFLNMEPDEEGVFQITDDDKQKIDDLGGMNKDDDDINIL